MFARRACNEELTPIRVLSIICHAQQTSFLVRVLKSFVFKIGASIDRETACAVAAYEVTALDHEVSNNPVEGRALVPLWIVAESVLACAELTEVLCCLWKLVREQLHLDSSKWLSIKVYVEEDNRIVRV